MRSFLVTHKLETLLILKMKTYSKKPSKNTSFSSLANKLRQLWTLSKMTKKKSRFNRLISDCRIEMNYQKYYHMNVLRMCNNLISIWVLRMLRQCSLKIGTIAPSVQNSPFEAIINCLKGVYKVKIRNLERRTYYLRTVHNKKKLSVKIS